MPADPNAGFFYYIFLDLRTIVRYILYMNEGAKV